MAHTVFASSSMNDDEIHSGRPYGGLTILVNDKLLSFYKYIGHSDDRCLAMMVQCKDMQLFLFNVYLLCFIGPDMYKSDIMHVIRFLENVLLENISVRKNIGITIGGDINFIENKLLSQASLNCFKELVRGIDVVLAKNSFQYTYHSKANNSYSKLDHFKMSDMLQCDCRVAAIVESSETFSDHSPFQNSIKVQMASVTKKVVLNLPDNDRPDWSNHSKELFYRNTADVLYAIPVLDDCLY